MNGQASAGKVATAKSATRLNRVPEKVRTKLKSFTVKDNQGHLVGKIKDVYFDPNGQLNFVSPMRSICCPDLWERQSMNI
ncbi:MAG: hypothetical protein EAZ69_05405 [Oscillatoriales cyanobacterium]|nr:MAG: hypothetical protein EAZ69_05405 [Oscillatoriales cyanobacterium]